MTAPLPPTLATVVPLLEAKALAAQQFTYHIPTALQGQVAVGQLVQVPFGRQGAIPALVLSLPTQAPTQAPLKPIEALLSPQPLFSPTHLERLAHIATYYGCPLGQVVLSQVPQAWLKGSWLSFKPSYQRVVSLTPPKPAKVPSTARLQALWGQAQSLCSPSLCSSGPSPAPVLWKEWVQALGTTSPTLQKLVNEGFLQVEERLAPLPLTQSLLGNEAADTPLPPLKPLRLNETQAQVVQRILEGPRQGKPFTLLHGVTGSGKTEVYMALAEATLAQGQGVLLLVPEIALTAPLAQRFLRRFPQQGIAVWHSQLTEREKQEVWHRVQSGACRFVIGPRSALSVPMENVGLLVLDEAHDDSYKQDTPAPRYDARQVAQYWANQAGARLVLGSATPTVEQYYHAEQGSTQGHGWQLCTLTERYGQAQLPTVEVVDLRVEGSTWQRGGLLSNTLAEALKATVAQGEQAVLLLNRRGFYTWMQCQDCGTVLQCQHCSVSLTYHAPSQHAKCHHCGYTQGPPYFCYHCTSCNVQRLGSGTQRVAQEVQELLGAETPVLRLDGDTLGNRHAAAELLQAFAQQQAPVLLGTQMVAKGLDVANVTLVGILNADSGLHFPEPKAFERSFQLLTQVAGRAGRGTKAGRVILQTWSPEHRVIEQAKHHHFLGFYQDELALRRDYSFPPFSQLLRLMVSAPEAERAQHFSKSLCHHLKALLAEKGWGSLGEAEVLGPSPCLIEKVQDRYRYHVLVKNKVGPPLQQALLAWVQGLTVPSGLHLLWDVDAQSLL